MRIILIVVANVVGITSTIVIVAVVIIVAVDIRIIVGQITAHHVAAVVVCVSRRHTSRSN